MKISGFTFVKNATKLYIPAVEAIRSVLPICDEFVVAIGDNDSDDNTTQLIEAIGDPKIKIIHTVWEKEKYPKNTIFAQQTDIAKDACTGDWLIYIQCDEAIHEDELPIIRKACERYHSDQEVEGLLFQYKHFWADYQHYHVAHGWYPKEIRVIRNLPNIHSWSDAQSFRVYEQFNGTFADYTRRENMRKLKVAEIPVTIFHYGYVRPPVMMSSKTRSSSQTYRGKEATEKTYSKLPDLFDYGPLNELKLFKGSHPAVMKEWIAKHDWKDQLQYSGKRRKDRMPFKHEKTKYRLLTFIEQNLLGGRHILTKRNYVIVRKMKP